MKHQILRRRRDSFTLVELLVVIAIIAILAGVLLGAATKAINTAKRAKAATTANSIQTAVLGYYTEYSVYPVGGATGDVYIPDTTAGTASWQALTEALCGNLHPSTGLAVTPSGVTNARGIPFLSLKASDVDGNDAPVNPVPTGTEGWFNISIDGDYNGILTNTVAGAQVVTTAGVGLWVNCNGTTSSTNTAWVIRTF